MFRKKSEDPWIPPEQAPQESRNPGALLDRFLAKRRDAAVAKSGDADLPPLKCPWCARPMTQGYIYGRGEFLWWNPGLFTRKLFESIPVYPETVRLSEGGSYSYKIAWRCKPCEKIVIDTTPRNPEEKEEPEEPENPL